MTALKFKRLYAGCYEATVGNVVIEIERTIDNYWGATITRGNYGDDDWKVVDIQAERKKELVEYCNNAVKYMDKEN